LKAEGKRYKADMEAGKVANDILWRSLNQYNANQVKNHKKQYTPEKHLTLGNHEYRIMRVTEDDPSMEGYMGYQDLGYEEAGWTVHDFLDVVEIDGLCYSHFFANPMSGRPWGGHSMDTRLKNIGYSFVQGHQQICLIGTRALTNGAVLRGLVCGACYLHDEDYRGKQGNSEWRGVFLLHEVRNGNYSLCEVSLDYLCLKYEGMPVWRYMEKNYKRIFESSLWMQKQKRMSTH